MKKYIDCTLPHGGKLRYVKNKISRSTRFRISFDSGARCDKIPGLSHFVEHMFFTGTENLTKTEINKKYFDFFDVNAQTNYNNISFVGNVITKEFPNYLDLLQELLIKSTFKPEAVKKECKVIQQEIAAYRDNFYGKSWWANDYNMFKTDYYKYEIIGTPETVASITSKDIWDYVKEYIVAESLVVNITSPLSFKKIKKLIIDKIESKLWSNPNFKWLNYWSEELANDKFYCLEHKDIGKTYINLNFAFDFSVFDFEEKQKIYLLTELMNHQSGLTKSLRTDKSLVYGCSFAENYFGDFAVYKFQTECDKKNVNEVLETLAKYLRKTLKDGFNEQTLKQVKHRIEYTKEVKEPNSYSPFSKLNDYYFYGKIINQKKLNKVYEKVTLEECNEAFKTIFATPRVSATVYGDITKNELLSEQEFFDLFNFSKPQKTKKKQPQKKANSKTTAKSKTISNETSKSTSKETKNKK